MKTAFNPVTIETFPQAVIGLGLAVHTPSTVWTGTLSASAVFPSDGTGVGTLSVTTVSGAFGNAVEGMTVLLGGVYRTYVRKSCIANTLYIGAIGDKTVATAIGTSFAVYNEYLPWPRRFRYDTGTWYCNFDETYVAQNENFGPQAIMGPAAIKYKNGSVTFNFDGSLSRAWTPGSTIASYLWTFPDGTTSSSATTTWATSTAYPNGAYVHLLVTDSNGDTHTGHRLLWKFDSSNKPKMDFEIVSPLTMQWGGGCQVQLRRADVDFAGGMTAPYHVALFGNTYYGTTQTDLGGNFGTARGNIFIEGFVTSIDTERVADTDFYTYTISTIDEVLRQQQGFALTMDDTSGSAASWLQMTNLSLDMIMWHYCRWRSTIGLMTDVYLCENTASGRAKKYMDFPASDMWTQVQTIYGWMIGGTVTADSQGALWCEQDAIVAATTGSLPNVFVSGDSTYTWRRSQESTLWNAKINPIAKFTAYGVDYATPVGSRAPDDPIAYGAGIEEIAAGIHATQTEINLWAGNRRAQLNANAFHRLNLRVLARIDPAPQCYWPNDPVGVVRACEIEFDLENGMAWANIDVEAVLSGTIQTGKTISFTSL